MIVDVSISLPDGRAGNSGNYYERVAHPALVLTNAGFDSCLETDWVLNFPGISFFHFVNTYK